MKKWRVFVNGTNFLLEMEGKVEKYGFYTTVYIKAVNEKDAENKAIDVLRKNKTLLICTKNKISDPPMMYAEEIAEVDTFDKVNTTKIGFTFYPEKAEEN